MRVDKKSRTTYKKQTTVVKGKKTTKTVAVRTPVRRIQVPLMAIQLRLLTVYDDGGVMEADPMGLFSPDNRLRLSVKANQRGYLYIIRQRSPEEDGEIIFPTLLANNGSNYVAANYEYVLPFNCPKTAIPNPRDCSLQLFPVAEAPQEYFTLIFTRDSLIGLPSDVKNTRGSIVNLMSAGKLKSDTLIDLIEESNQDLVSQRGDTDYAVRIVNINAKDNEEIIETFVLNKESE